MAGATWNGFPLHPPASQVIYLLAAGWLDPKESFLKALAPLALRPTVSGSLP